MSLPANSAQRESLPGANPTGLKELTQPQYNANNAPQKQGFYDPASERVILSAILNHGFEGLPENAPTSGRFFTDPHALIFDALRELKNGGKSLDVIQLTQHLHSAGRLEQAGGAAYVTELLSESCFPAVLQSACDSVAKRFKGRELHAMLSRAIAMTQSGEVDKGVELIDRTLPGFKSFEAEIREPKIKFHSPGELRSYIPEDGAVLVGNHHIERGDVFVIGGEPGVGKSIASTELAICGATGRDWLGLKVHCRFKTLIIQNENGRYRLMSEYKEREYSQAIEDSIRVSEPPPFGMTLNDPEFLHDVEMALKSFKPDVVLFDPWNAVAKDDKAKDYQDAFTALRAMLPTGKDKPALGIVAHTRKPGIAEKRTGGTGLMHLLAGSYVLSSVPRTVFIMVPGSNNDESSNAVVWFNPKCNNGEKVSRSAWLRDPAGFISLDSFDWDAFDGGTSERKTICIEFIEKALGDTRLKKSDAVKRLMAASTLGERACQKALSENGNFAARLKFEDGFISLK